MVFNASILHFVRVLALVGFEIRSDFQQFDGVGGDYALSTVWLFIGCLRRLFPKPLHLEQAQASDF